MLYFFYLKPDNIEKTNTIELTNNNILEVTCDFSFSYHIGREILHYKTILCDLALALPKYCCTYAISL